MSGFINALLPTIILLGGLIFIHELGHFWAAKLVNIEVKRFSLGLGPVVWSRTWGETEYALSAIPLGGYVKMGGMADEVMDRVEGGDGGSDGAPEAAEFAEERKPGPRDFDGKPLWARAFVISAGVTMNFIFAFLAYVAIAGIWGVEVPDTNRIGAVDTTLLPVEASELGELPDGARISRIGDRAVESWIDLREAVLGGAAGPVTVLAVDPEMEIAIRIPPEESDRQALLAAIQPWVEPVIGGVEPSSPADRGGIEAGDRILALDGAPVASWMDFVRQVEPRGGQRVEIALEREGERLTRTVELGSRPKQMAGGEVRDGVGYAGLVPDPGPMVEEEVGAVEAIALGWTLTVRQTGAILGFLGDLVTGRTSPRSVGSIVMIGQVSGQAAEAGFEVFLGFMALFSLNLAVLNLLPIPVLDGGHLVFLAIEGLRGRAISMEQRIRWSNVGLVVLMVIMVWALGNDFLRVFGL